MRFRPPVPVSLTLNLAPMVDVMMCLIIFFLLAGRLLDEQFLPLELAAARQARPADRRDVGRLVVNVRPGPAGRAEYVVTRWDGRRIVPQALGADELAAWVRQRSEELRRLGHDPWCMVRADRAVRYADVERVLRACGLAGLPRVVFGTAAAEDD